MRAARIVFRVVMVLVIIVLGALLLLRVLTAASADADPPGPPAFTEIEAEASDTCASAGTAEVTVSLRWATTGADDAWMGLDTDDAEAEPQGTADPSGSAAIEVTCPVEPSRWTITVRGEGGVAHETIRILPGEPDEAAPDEKSLYLGDPPPQDDEGEAP